MPWGLTGPRGSVKVVTKDAHHEDKTMRTRIEWRLSKTRQCDHPGCERKCVRNWTTCPTHYSGGEHIQRKLRNEEKLNETPNA